MIEERKPAREEMKGRMAPELFKFIDKERPEN
jgi:hypothetical protein